MRAFLEKYGEAIFVMIVLMTMILLGTPLGRGVLEKVALRFNEMKAVTTPVGCDHEFEEQTGSNVEPTCTENGKVIYKCKLCGDTLENKTAKKDHTLVLVDRVDPNCNSNGYAKYRCTECEGTDTIVLMKKTHSFEFDERLIEPTKTTEGLDQYQCSECSLIDTVNVPKKPTNEDNAEFSYKLLSGPELKNLLHNNYSKIGDIKKITFTDEDAPEGTILYDVSELQDRSVMMWVKLSSKELFISTQTPGVKVKANLDCQKMFYNEDNDTSNKMFRSVEEVNVSNLDVSKTKNMSAMFREVGTESSSVKFTGFGSWNTSNVTNMSYMFYNVGQMATAFDIGNIVGWNTANVTNMNYTFYNMAPRVVYKVDLKGWNVGKVSVHKNFNTSVEDRVIAPDWY